MTNVSLVVGMTTFGTTTFDTTIVGMTDVVTTHNAASPSVSRDLQIQSQLR